MLDPTAWARTATRVSAADFYRPDHRIIFDAIAHLQDKCLDTDAVAVSDYLERRGTLGETGGLSYIGRLVKDTPSAVNV
jgi:replicative DNA helicase